MPEVVGRGRLKGYGTVLHAAAAFAALIFAVVLFPAGGRDDVHISYWPAYTLSELGEIINYNGERVEQSSSMLWVLLLASLRKALGGVDLTMLGPVVSLSCAALVLALLPRLSRAIGAGAPAGLWAVVVLGTIPWFAYWAPSGMETVLDALLLLGTTLLTYDAIERGTLRWPVAVPLVFAYLLVRPESGFVLACVCLGLLGVAGLRIRFGDGGGRALGKVALQLLGLTAVLATFMVLARLAYFGSPVPQPVLAKSAEKSLGLFVVFLGLGALYVGAGLFTYLLPASIVGTVYSVRSLRRDRMVVLAPLLMFGIVRVCFVVTSGGDWMEGYRFLVAGLPLLAVLIGAELARISRRPVQLAAGGALVALHVVAAVHFSTAGSMSLRLWEAGVVVEGADPDQASWRDRSNIVHIRDLRTLTTLEQYIVEMHDRGMQNPVIWSSQGGFIPFTLGRKYYGRFTWYDPAGLLDRHFWDCDPLRADLTSSIIGLASREHMEGAFLERRAVNASLVYVEHKDDIAACGIPFPDIVFMLGLPERMQPLLDAYDLVTIYSQDGAAHREEFGHRPILLASLFELFNESGTKRERSGVAATFIGMRRDLAKSLGLEPVIAQFGPIRARGL